MNIIIVFSRLNGDVPDVSIWIVRVPIMNDAISVACCLALSKMTINRLRIELKDSNSAISSLQRLCGDFLCSIICNII